MIYVYALKSVNHNYIYVGMTNNISVRFNEHNSGYERTTKPYLPFRLIYFEKCLSRKEARLREKYLKSGIGKEFLKSIDHIIDPFTLSIIKT
ncbi:MAG: GIY-YIG nuclease family protein [Melioribacteraceae bacterium]|nr:GIY-YIG nuclease family protein [Melioribacteraceae bacterium]